MFVVGIIVAFVYSWKLTLVCRYTVRASHSCCNRQVIIAMFPLLITAGAAFNKLLVQGNTKSQKLYAGAGAIADEALTLIRTVISFGTQQRETER